VTSDGLILNFLGPQGARNFTGGPPPWNRPWPIKR